MYNDVVVCSRTGDALLKQKALLAVFIVAWFALFGLVLAPPLGDSDTYFYKDAGANLALGHGLVSALTSGNPSFEPRLYAQYPPLLGVAFGAFGALFGVGPRQNVLFNLAVSSVLALLVFRLFSRRDAPGGWRFYRPALAALVALSLPMAFSLGDGEGDRPDALGLVAAMAALLALGEAPGLGRYFAAAFLAGVALEISPICGVLAAIAVAVFWLSRRRRGVPFWRLAPVAAGGFALCPAVVTGVLLLLDPTWLDRFLGIGAPLASPQGENPYLTERLIFLNLLTGHVGRFLAAYDWQNIRQLGHLVQYVKLALVWAAMLGYGAWRLLATRSPFGLGSVLLAAAVGLVPLLLMPYQVFYVGIVAGVVLALFALVASPPEPAGLKAAQLAILAGLAGIVAVNAPLLARQLLYQAQLGPSLERMTETLARLKQQHVFDGKIIAVPPELYMLFKQQGLEVVSWYGPYVDEPLARQRIAFFALQYYGTGDPLRPMFPAFWEAKNYELVYEPRLPQLATLFGRPISHSSVTWEAAIYRSRLAQ